LHHKSSETILKNYLRFAVFCAPLFLETGGGGGSTSSSNPPPPPSAIPNMSGNWDMSATSTVTPGRAAGVSRNILSLVATADEVKPKPPQSVSAHHFLRSDRLHLLELRGIPRVSLIVEYCWRRRRIVK